jgi:hypothetical protein
MHRFVQATTHLPIKDKLAHWGSDRDSYITQRLVRTWWSINWHTCGLASSGMHISKLLRASKSSRANYWWALQGKLLKAYNVGPCEPSFVNHALRSIKEHRHPPNKPPIQARLDNNNYYGSSLSLEHKLPQASLALSSFKPFSSNTYTHSLASSNSVLQALTRAIWKKWTNGITLWWPEPL